MTVYVDDSIFPYRKTYYCHMMTDSDLGELHAMADTIGLRRAWFQHRNPRHPHYDLSPRMRARAIAAGAVAVSSKELIQRCVTRLEPGHDRS